MVLIEFNGGFLAPRLLALALAGEDARYTSNVVIPDIDGDKNN